MDLDEELDTMEDGAETEAEQTGEETELQDLEDFEDEGLGVDAEETDLEDAYEEFYYSEEGPEGEGESSDAGDGGLATMDAGETAELGGMGFHLVDEEEARATEDLVDEASGEEGVIRDYDGFAASEEDEELADDLANLADDDEGIEALDGIDDAAYQGFDDEDAAGANDGANDGVDAVPADAAGEDGEEDEEYEEVELEFSEEDIVCYLVDEDDNEIGFTLLDEDGNEVEFEHIDTVEYEGTTYLAFIPAELSLEEDAEVVIMQIVEEDGEEMLEAVEDDEIADAVFNIVMERAEAEEDE